MRTLLVLALLAAAEGKDDRAELKKFEGTWQLVTGGIEEGETAWQAALRELREEAGLEPAEFFHVDCVNTFYLAQADSIMHSPMFCALVAPDTPPFASYSTSIMARGH